MNSGINAGTFILVELMDLCSEFGVGTGISQYHQNTTLKRIFFWRINVSVPEFQNIALGVSTFRHGVSDNLQAVLSHQTILFSVSSCHASERSRSWLIC